MFCGPDSKFLLEKNPARVGNSGPVDISLHPLFKRLLRNKKRSDPVAQSVEHLTFNQGVMGSSPIGITTCKANFLIFRMLAFFVFCLGMDLAVSVSPDLPGAAGRLLAMSRHVHSNNATIPHNHFIQ